MYGFVTTSGAGFGGGPVVERGKPGDCVSCGNCEKECPQKLPIIDTMAKIAKIVG